MQETILISMPVADLQTIITDCVNTCLKTSLSDNTEQEQDSLLNIQQAATLLGLSVATLYSKVSKAEIPVSKQGNRLYFSKQELTNWIKTGRKKTISEMQADAEKYLHTKNKRG